MSDTMTPTWTLADRLTKARTTANMTQQAIADQLGVSRNTVQKWESGSNVKRSILMAWSMATGVPLWWIEGHDAGPDDGGDVPGPPTDWKVAHLRSVGLAA